MTEATFEDFLDIAMDRFDRAALSISDGAPVSAATCTALSAATRSLMRLSTRYGLLPSGTPAATWQPALLDHLATADRCFRHHARADATPSPADALITDAARLLTVAQDLLGTHLTTRDSPRQFARTPEGEELLDAPVRDHLLRRAAEIAAHLGALTRAVRAFDDLPNGQPHLAQAYRPREKGLAAAERELACAAAQCPESATKRLEVFPAPVLAAAVTYPSPHEAPTDAAEQIQHALRRMAAAAYQAARRLRTSEYPPVHTASDLRETATHLAAACSISADLLTRLTPYLPSNGAWKPADAVEQLQATGAAWLRLRRAWAHTFSIPDSGPRSPLTVQVASVVVRIGRLMYVDSAWTPDVGPGRPRPLSDLLASEVFDALVGAVCALPRESAVIAANQARLVSDGVLELHSLDRTHRPQDEGRRLFPLQPAQRAELVAGYRYAVAASKAAVTAMKPISGGRRILEIAARSEPTLRISGANPARARQQQPQGPRLQPAGDRTIAKMR
jgi:hypothetical protein